MAGFQTDVSDELLKLIKGTLRVTHSALDDDIKDTIKEGMVEVQSKVGPINFDGESATSIKAVGLLKTYCFYSHNNMAQDFSKDLESDILALQIHIIQYGR